MSLLARRRFLLSAQNSGYVIYNNGYTASGRAFSDMGWSNSSTTCPATLTINGTFTDDNGDTKTAIVLTTTDNSSSGAAGVSCLETTGFTGAELKKYSSIKVECSLTAQTLICCMLIYNNITNGYYGNTTSSGSDVFIKRLNFNGRTNIENDSYACGAFYNTVYEIAIADLSLNDTTTYYIGFRSQTGKTLSFGSPQLCITKLWLE